MKHSLVGKKVNIWHGPEGGIAYQPVKVLDIDEPFIYVGPCEESRLQGHITGEMKPIWIPIHRIHWAEEVE